MLIEFSVSNFRSFRARQTLSMVAAPRLRKKNNLFQPDVVGEKFPPLLKVAAIYGANASGKSSLLKAIEILSRICNRKPSVQDDPLPVSPFRFDSALRNEPSRFEVHFIQQKRRYSYELALTASKIVEERLVAFVKGKTELLFHRFQKDGREEYLFGSFLEGGSELHDTWRKLTSSQTLFVMQAVANSNEELTQLRIPFSWLSEGTLVVASGMESIASLAQRLVLDMPSFGDDAASLLRDVDVPISEIKVKAIDSGDQAGTIPIDSDRVSKSLPAVLRRGLKVKTTLTHQTTLGSAEFDFSEESDGTKNIFCFAFPWLVLRNQTAMSHKILIVDELDSSLHPKVVEALIKRHLDDEAPTQLIFTTHDTHLMDTKLLRRDQFFLTERDATGATQLRSIHDFEGRESEDIEKRYYEGRYRGLPMLRKTQK